MSAEVNLDLSLECPTCGRKCDVEAWCCPVCSDLLNSPFFALKRTDLPTFLAIACTMALHDLTHPQHEQLHHTVHMLRLALERARNEGVQP